MKYLLLTCFILFGLTACSTSQDNKIAIAILTPVTHPSLEQIQKGFIETLETQSPDKYRFVIYNAQGNKTLMRSEVEEIAQKNYALVMPIGSIATQMITEVFSKKEIDTPIVFTVVNHPENYQLDSMSHVTGVEELLDVESELKILKKVQPNLKTLLLVFNPAEPGLINDQLTIKRILNEQNLNLITVETFQSNEIKAKVTPFIDKAQAILVLKDNTVVSGLDVLVKLCEKHRIPLMTSDLDSPDRGAALGYGVYEIEFGKEAAKKALSILEEGKVPSQIPISTVEAFDLLINREAAVKQGLSIERLDQIQGEI